MKHKYIERLIVSVLIVLSFILGSITAPITLPKVEAWTGASTVRDFYSVTEFREVTAELDAGTTFLMGDSVDHARFFAETLRHYGYDVSVSYLPWTHHLGILGFVDHPVYEGKVLMFYDVEFQRYWRVHEWNGMYYWPNDFSSGSWQRVADDEPNWGKGGKPKPGKPKK